MIQYLYEFKYPPDIIPSIDYKKDAEDKKWKKENFDTFYIYDKFTKKDEKKKEEKNTKEEDVFRMVKMAIHNKLGPMEQNIITDMDPENIHSITIKPKILNESFEVTEDSDVQIFIKQEKVNVKENEKFNILKFMMVGNEIHKLIRKYSYCKREEIIFQFKIMVIYQLYQYLEIGGQFLTTNMNFCTIESINYIYLLSLLFERIILIDGSRIHGFGFLGDRRIPIYKFKELLNKKFYIHPKPNLESMIQYIDQNFENRMKIEKMIKNHKYTKYIDESFYKALNGYMETSLDSKKIKIILDNFLLYFKIQKTPQWIVDFMKESRKKEIKALDILLNSISQKMFITRVLKIGMSYGMYEEELLNIKPNLQIKIISKEQNNYWEKVGMDYLESKGLKDHIELISEEIFYALPKLLQNYGESSMDLIFIEEVLSIDKMIYLWMHFGLMIRTYGFIIFDKMVNVSLYSFFDFINKNYPTFQKIETDSGLVIYKKINRFALDIMIKSF